MKQYREVHVDQAHTEYNPNEIKVCSKCGFEGKASLFRKGRNICKKCRGKYNKKYLEESRESIIQYRKKNYTEHQEKFIAFQRQYRRDNKETITRKAKIKYDADPTYKLDINRKYIQTPKGRTAKRKKLYKRRKLGHNPINKLFKNSHFHHLHLNNDNAIGIYIPKEIHESVWHSSKIRESMNEINKVALLWLCNQAII